MRENRYADGSLASYELVMRMTDAEAGPGDESRVTLESAERSIPYHVERLVMDMADDDIRRHFGGRFKVTVAPMGEDGELQCDGIPAFADLCEDNAAAVATATRSQLEKVWSVGDELRMHLAASADGKQPEQDVVWVVMGFGCKRVTYDECNVCDSRVVLGLKDGLIENMPGGKTVKAWLNSITGFSSMLPAWFLSLFVTTVNNIFDCGCVLKTLDGFWLPSEVEVFGCTQWSDGEMEQREEQLPYYAGRRDRRVKRKGVDGSADVWWERSPWSGVSGSFCSVDSGGGADADSASIAFLLAPAGCF